MTVAVSEFETQDVLFVQFHADALGDKFALPRVSEEFDLLVARGSAKVTEYRKEPFDVESPSVVLLSAGAVDVVANSPTLTVFCIFDKNSSPLDEVASFLASVEAKRLSAPRGF